MNYQKWYHFIKSTNQITIPYTVDSIETCQFILELSSIKNKTIFLTNVDIDFPPPKKPYKYEKYFRKEEVPLDYESIDYYDKVNMDVINIVEKNNIHIVTYSASIYHPNITCIPLGIYHQFHHFHLKNEKSTLCYMNMGMPCDRWFGNPRKNISIPFALQKSNLSTDEYYEDISKSKFMICPRGCGIDTYRMWDCIVLGCIPIVQKYYGHQSFEDLPILFVDDYDITEEFLNQTYEIFSKRSFNYEKCTIDYWINNVTRRMETFQKK